MKPLLVSLVGVGLALGGMSAASCAESGATPRPDEPDGIALPPAADSERDPGDASEVPCDAAGTGCAAPCDVTDWCPVATTIDARLTLNAVWGSSPTDVWTVGAGGTIAHWDGTSWTSTPTGTSYTLNTIWGSGSRDVWAASTPDVILHSAGFQSGGASWEVVTPIETNPYAIFSVLVRGIAGTADGSALFIGGDWMSPPFSPDTNQVWRTGRAPLDWSPLGQLERFNVRGMWLSDDQELWLVGQRQGGGGKAYRVSTRSNDGGADAGDSPASWDETDIQSANALRAVWGTSASDIWAVGTQGTIRHFAGQSSRWDEVSSPTGRDLHAVWASGPSDAWIAGDEGTLLHWDGSSWTSMTATLPGPPPNLFGIWGSGAGDVWAVGERGTILHSSGAKAKVDGGKR